MTVQETSTIMNVLNAAYPGFYAKSSDAERKQILSLWAEMFREDDVALVAAAVKALIVADASSFPPTIGQVKARLRQITTPQEMTEGEAWALVAAAIRNSAYDSRREFERLPEAARRFVGSPSQLREWASMDTGTVQSVVQSNFMRSYRARQESDRKMQAVPADVRAKLAGMAEVKQLPSYDLALAERMMDYNSGNG